MSATVTPYRSARAPGPDGFPQLLRAEWTKLRTVRGWVIALLAVAFLTAAVPSWLSGTATSNDPVTCAGSTCQVEGQDVAIGPAGAVVTDSFPFVHQPAGAAATLTARVAGLAGAPPFPSVRLGTAGPPVTEPWAKAGLIMKASTKPGAAYVAIMVTGAHGIRMQADFTGDIAGPSAAGTSWLRLVRAGDRVTGYSSADGRTWTQVGTITEPDLPATAQAGLFVTSPTFQHGTGSGDNSVMLPTQASARFTAVTLRGGTSGRAWQVTRVGVAPSGPPGPPGPGNPGKPASPGQRISVTGHDGRYTITGSGDIAPFEPIVDPMHVVYLATLFGLLAAVGLGTAFMTAEYRRSLIRTTVTASPRRARILLAKSVIVAAATFATALAGAAVAFPLARHNLLRNGWTTRVWPDYTLTGTDARLALGAAAIAAAAAVLGLAAGTIFRRSAGAITAVIGVLVLPLVLALVAPLTVATWLVRVTPAAAFAMGATVPSYPQLSTVCAPYHGCFPLSPWNGYLVLCAWAVVALAGAVWLLRRRDV